MSQLLSQLTQLTDSEDEDTVEVLYGQFRADIVGIRYYTGRVNNKEMVALCREPNNQYDKNAVRVVNVLGQQVGHIKKEQAAALAFVMDKKYARKVEGVVPFGTKNKFSMPCDVALYGIPGEMKERCCAVMKLKGYQLNKCAPESFSEGSTWEGLGNTSTVVLSKNGQKTQTPPPAYAASKFSTGKLMKLSQDKIKQELENLFENLVKVGKLKTQEPYQVVKTKLYTHQKQALAWMSSCENKTELPPFWTKVDKWYHNSCTNFMTEARPLSLNGGLLADDMGIGKTLSMIALIATNYRDKKPFVTVGETMEYKVKSQSTKRKQCIESVLVISDEEESLSIEVDKAECVSDIADEKFRENNTVTIASTRSRRCSAKKPRYIFSSDESGDDVESLLNKSDIAPKKKFSKIDKSSENFPVNSDISEASGLISQSDLLKGEIPFFKCTRVDLPGPRATLIVCPMSVLSNWQNQLQTHLIENSLDIYTYYGADRVQNPTILSKKDVVLTTYQTLSYDFKVSSPLHKVKWLRVILDESHVIRNTNSNQSKACLALDAERRWLITGTPVQNSIKDLWSVVTFLRIEPFTKREWWTRSIERPIQNGEKGSLKRLQGLMSTISLRRTKFHKVDGKNLVELPAKTVYIQKIKLSKEEKDLYNMFKNEGHAILERYVKEKTLNENFAHVLVVLMRLRQLCCHPKLCMKMIDFASKMSFASASSPELIKKLQQILSVLLSSGDEECPVCLDSLNRPVITFCAHLFCRQCIEDVIRTDKPKCPICRNEVTKEKLVEPEIDGDNPSAPGSEKWSSSSKVDGLITLLNKERDENARRKHLVVSQFSSFLDLLEKPLTESGYKFVRLDGKMSMQQRNNSISLFSTVKDSSPTIMLLSLKAGGLGINLTKATRVFLMDPAWNPATEDQCFDRCHRLGQTEEVKIYKFIVEDSVEENMLELQNKKRELMSNAFGKKETAKEKQQRRFLDAQSLLGL